MSLEASIGFERDHLRLDAEFSARSGETVVLVGPNGAGKSSLVEALAGLLPLARGRVVLDGEVLEDPVAGIRVPARRRGIGVMFQSLHLFPHLSVRDNVGYGLVSRGVRRRAARRQTAALLERLGLADLAQRRARELSGGEAQRVALARALALEPRLLLLDEPLSAFDVERRAETRALLSRVLAEFEGAKLIVAHDPLEALLLADRLVVLEAGRVVQSGDPEALRSAPRSRYVASLVGQNLISGRLSASRGRTLLVSGDTELVVADPGLPAGTEVFAVIPPRSVTVSVVRPASSARNTLAGRIEWLDRDGDRVRLRIGSSPPLLAEITADAAAALGLAVGRAAFASLKATEIDVYPR